MISKVNFVCLPFLNATRTALGECYGREKCSLSVRLPCSLTVFAYRVRLLWSLVMVRTIRSFVLTIRQNLNLPIPVRVRFKWISWPIRKLNKKVG